MSNFIKLHTYFRCKVIPAVNQIEFNPYIADKDILDVCKEHGIVVQAYGPIGSGARDTFVGGPKEGEPTRHGKCDNP